MKRCPACGSTFTDDSLRFCLQDGATLLRVSNAPQNLNLAETLRDDSPSLASEPPPTEQINFGTAPTVQLGQAAPTVGPRPHLSTRETNDARAPVKKTNVLAIVLITVAAVLLVALTGFGIVYLLRDKTSVNANATTNSNTQGGNARVENVGNANVKANANNQNANAYQSNANQSSAEPRVDVPPKITATASSTLAPVRGNTYVASNVLDGSLLTAWSEGVSGPGVGEWIRCDFDREVKLRRILITPGYFKSTALWSQNNRLAAATFSFSDGTSRRFTFPDRMQEQRLDVGNVKTRWVRLTIDDTYSGSVDSEDTPISQMTFEWEK